MTGVRLFSSDLTDANLDGANLKEAHLHRTILSGANLTDTKGLDQEHLSLACGDDKTLLPKGLEIRLCGENDYADEN